MDIDVLRDAQDSQSSGVILPLDHYLGARSFDLAHKKLLLGITSPPLDFHWIPLYLLHTHLSLLTSLAFSVSQMHLSIQDLKHGNMNGEF